MLVHVIVLRYLCLAGRDLVVWVLADKWLVVPLVLVSRGVPLAWRVPSLILGSGSEVVANGLEFVHLDIHFLRLNALVLNTLVHCDVRVQRIANHSGLWGNALVQLEARGRTNNG